MGKPAVEVSTGLKKADENSMVSWFKKADDAVQMMFIDDEQVAVTHDVVQKNYEVFSVQGAYAKINVDHFIDMPTKVGEMGEGLNKDGTPKKSGDEADLFMSAWCINKITATKDEKATRDNIWKLRNFVHDIVFAGNEGARESPPAGISKHVVSTTTFVWESHKYRVQMAKAAYRKLEEKTNKKLKKFNKNNDPDILRKAESELVKVLQKNMKLRPQQFSSSQGFSNYFIVMFDAMFPDDFGTDTRIKKLKEDGVW